MRTVTISVPSLVCSRATIPPAELNKMIEAEL
jgi:hypothetical protein